MKQALRCAVKKGTGVRFITYKHRFVESTPASGVSKSDMLASGAWKGQCSAAGISRLWPTGALSESDAKASLSVFDSIIAKGKGNMAAAQLGKVRALINMNDFGTAQSFIASMNVTQGQPEYPAFLASKLTLAMSRNCVNSICGIADENLSTTTVANTEIAAIYKELAAICPLDWTIPLVYGEYLQVRGEQAAIDVLETAALLASKEVNGRKSKSETYVNDRTSIFALADYLDYKYRSSLSSNVASVLESELAIKPEPEFETTLKQYKGLTDVELRALISFEAAIAAGDFGFAAYSHDPAKVAFNDFNGFGATDTQFLMHKYAGGDVGVVQRGCDKSVDEQISMASLTETSSDVGSLLNTQKQLGVRLAEQGLARCRVALGNALIDHQRPTEALNVLNLVISETTYLKMHDAFEARGKVCFSQVSWLFTVLSVISYITTSVSGVLGVDFPSVLF